MADFDPLSDPLLAGQAAPDDLIQAMRRMGLIGQLSGDKVIAPMGQGLEQQAGQMVNQQRLAAQTEALNRHRMAMEALRQQQINKPQGPQGPRWHLNAAGNEYYDANSPAPAPADPSAPPTTPAGPLRVPAGPIVPKPSRGAPLRKAITPPDATPDPYGLEPAGKDLSPLATKFQKDMDAAAASSRSAFGESARVVFRGARNLALLNQKNPDGSQKQLTEPEWQEVAGGLVSMQTGGVPTQEMMKHALPKDVKGDAASIMSWLTSNPHAPDRQQWIERFIANIDREEKTALKYQRDTQVQRIPSNSEYFSKYPKRAKLAAKAYGFDPADVDKILSGAYQSGGESAAAAPGAPVKVTTKAEAMALPAGTHFLDPNGVERVR